VYVDQGAADRGHVRGQFAHLRHSDLFAGHIVCKRLSQVREQLCFFVFREELNIDREDRIDLEQDGHGQWPLVLFELVHVAWRQLQRLGERHLRQPALLPQAPEPHAHKGLFHISPELIETFAIFASQTTFARNNSLFQSFSSDVLLRILRIVPRLARPARSRSNAT
jgi:hypothetical protein